MKGGATLLVGAWQHGKQEVMHQSIPAMPPPPPRAFVHIILSGHLALSLPFNDMFVGRGDKFAINHL